MTSALPRYDRYKDSHSPWLGKVPEHWALLPGLAMVKENKEKNLGLIEDTVLSLSYGKVVIRPPEKLTGLVPESFETYQVINPGDIVVRPTDLQNDTTSLRTGLANDRGIITSAYICLRPVGNANPKYLHYLLHAYDLMKVFYGLGSGLRQNLDYRDFKRLQFLSPPADEQERIVNFLDQKTAEIDAAITKKQRLIDLLKEQKAILINQAITEGLESETAYVTGNPFFPALPGAVSLIKLGYLCKKIADGPHFSPNYVDKGHLFLSAGNIRPDRWLLDDVKYVSERDYKEFSKRVVPKKGDVLYTKGGTTGVAKVVDLDVPFQVWVHVAVLKVREEMIDPFYLAYALNSPKCYEQAQLYTRGATNNDLGLTRMVNICLPVPHLKEQKALVEYMDRCTVDFNNAIAISEQEIEYLDELKGSLISEAVTGKLKI